MEEAREEARVTVVMGARWGRLLTSPYNKKAKTLRAHRGKLRAQRPGLIFYFERYGLVPTGLRHTEAPDRGAPDAQPLDKVL